ncbi:hypothetical protein ES705_50137 [subsurface metagenome]
MKIIHLADIHWNRENQDLAHASLETVYNHILENGADLVVIAGDLFDRAIQNTTSGGFPKLVRILQRIMNLCPIVAVEGTASHDIPAAYCGPAANPSRSRPPSHPRRSSRSWLRLNQFHIVFDQVLVKGPLFVDHHVGKKDFRDIDHFEIDKGELRFNPAEDLAPGDALCLISVSMLDVFRFAAVRLLEERLPSDG